MSTLHFCSPDGAERTYPLVGDAVIFGRARECDLVLEAKGVSRRHGRFTRGEDGLWRVEDLGSKNGVLVGGCYVTQRALADGDVITIGEVSITFRTDAVSRSTATCSLVTISDEVTPSSAMERAPDTPVSMDARRLTAIYEISKRLMDQRDVPGLIDVASSALIAELHAGVVVFGLTRDPERETDRLVVRPVSVERVGITLSRSVLRRTLDAQRAMVVTDTRTDELLAGAQSIVAGGIRSALCVPLMRERDVTGFIYVDSRRGGRTYDDRDLEFAVAVGAMVGTAIENARLHAEELVKQRMEAELIRARKVQQAILPSSWPVLEGWEVHGQHATCREVGGDYYDAVVAEDGRLWFLIADVMGKGVPAALLASSIHAAAHAMIDQCASPGHLLTRLNDLLLRRPMETSFVTCLVGAIQPKSGEVLLASAGHPHPICVAPNAAPAAVVVEGGFALGVCRGIQFDDTRWMYPAAGSALIAYTDGLTEAFDVAGDAFGEERILHTLSQCGSASATDLVAALQGSVEAFRGACEQSDDLTILACRRSPLVQCAS